jgi:hypothetical protein
VTVRQDRADNGHSLHGHPVRSRQTLSAWPLGVMKANALCMTTRCDQKQKALLCMTTRCDEGKHALHDYSGRSKQKLCMTKANKPLPAAGRQCFTSEREHQSYPADVRNNASAQPCGWPSSSKERYTPDTTANWRRNVNAMAKSRTHLATSKHKPGWND